MKTLKMKKALLAIGLGIGMSSAVASSPLQQACQSFWDACQGGEQFACERYNRTCR